MDAIKFFKEKDRMTNKCNIFCSECPLSTLNNGFKENGCIVNKCPKKAIEIVENWSKEHPVKTRQSEFIKIFPNPTYYFGVINICPKVIQKDYKPKEVCGEIEYYRCKKEYWFEEIE